MRILEALGSRRAVRDFTPDAVSREVLAELAEAATLAPSHMNLQPWSFSIVSDRDTVSRFGRAAKQYLVKNLDRSSPFFAQREEIAAPGYDLFYGAPALVVISSSKPDRLSDLGCAMAAHSLMLAAVAMGLGSCWVSQAQPWLNSPEGRRELGLAPDLHPVAPVIVGCPQAAPLSPGRFQPRIHWVA